jgi:hypothetical protein
MDANKASAIVWFEYIHEGACSSYSRIKPVKYMKLIAITSDVIT